MVRKLDNKNMGRSDLGWLKSIFHFSFSSYYNPKNMSFGALRVINDDLIRSNTGFEMHPHRDMEIVSYVVDSISLSASIPIMQVIFLSDRNLSIAFFKASIPFGL